MSQWQYRSSYHTQNLSDPSTETSSRTLQYRTSSLRPSVPHCPLPHTSSISYLPTNVHWWSLFSWPDVMLWLEVVLHIFLSTSTSLQHPLSDLVVISLVFWLWNLLVLGTLDFDAASSSPLPFSCSRRLPWFEPVFTLCLTCQRACNSPSAFLTCQSCQVLSI